MDRDPVAVDLGLQGGGAHGAFTWGVLDRLLEENWLRFDGISGTSAGAMNAVVMADGLAAGGPGQARDFSRAVLETRIGRGPAQSLAPRPARDPDRPMDTRLLAGVRGLRCRGADALAL